MKRLIPITISAVFMWFASCAGEAEPTNETTDSDTLLLDTLQDTLVDSTLFMSDSGYVNEEAETDVLIEMKYGEQWDFCDCVVKNDSINKVVDNAGDDADYDAIFARMDTIDAHCKGLLTTPNTTPDERAAHERKVRKCLKNAGVY